MHLKKSLFLVLSILIFSLSLNAQTDSLQGKSYEELIALYETTVFKNANNAKIYALAANKIAKKENDIEKLGWSIYHIAYANSYVPSYTESLEGIKESINIAKQTDNNLLLFKNHNLRGNVLSETKKEFAAIEEYDIAKKYAALTNNPLNIIVANVNIAFIKKIHKDHEEAIALFEENLALLDDIITSDPKKETYKKQILFNLADCYLRIKKPKEAAKYNNLALHISNEKDSPLLHNVLLMNKAIINYQNKDFDTSIAISKKTEKYFKSIHNEDQLVTPYFYLGKNYFKKNEFKVAIKYLEKANDIITRKKIAYSDQKEGYEILYKCYKKLGDSENADKNFELYLVLDKKTDSIDLSVNNKIHKEHDIVPLQKEIALLDTTNQKQKTRAKYLYISLAFLFFILVGFFIWFKGKQRQNKLRFQKLLVTIETLEKPKEKIVSEKIINKETTSPVTDENALQILKALEAFEEKELYLRQDCTLGYVAKKVKTNTSYLSNVINTYKEKSFKSYLSELRINAALVQLKNDDKLRSYTIKAIAEEFGFKRSETFSRAFKAQTDIYPSVYIKNLEDQYNK
ncbi:helix-turn-helix domain-containing protein [Kordia sp.]|uniref:helix-turn-helix domain-containing protein n=1 Tax=Kordia sp. TaxID=1965332 RepID=UPI003D6ABF88